MGESSSVTAVGVRSLTKSLEAKVANGCSRQVLEAVTETFWEGPRAVLSFTHADFKSPIIVTVCHKMLSIHLDDEIKCTWNKIFNICGSLLIKKSRTISSVHFVVALKYISVAGGVNIFTSHTSGWRHQLKSSRNYNVLFRFCVFYDLARTRSTTTFVSTYIHLHCKYSGCSRTISH